MRRTVFLLVWLIALTATAQTYKGAEVVRARLVSDTSAVVSGRPFTVGLLLEMAPGWHTYWQYSGDSGLSTKLKWTLPEGFSATPIEWPMPERIVEEGDIVTYGYGHEVLLFTTITPPPTLPLSPVRLQADASWLVCKKICIPGSAEGLSLDLPVAENSSPTEPGLFERHRKFLPRKEAPPFRFRWEHSAEALRLVIEGVTSADAVDFFPLPPEGIQPGHPEITGDGDRRIVRIPLAQPPSSGAGFAGIVTVGMGDARRGWKVTMDGASAAAAEMAPAVANIVIPPGGVTLASALLLGFAGGFILNLMPCVLPVIALKIFGFLKQAGESRQTIMRLGLAFVAGIFAWFMALAALIAGFKLAGRDLNWAFQFQNPAFVLGMTVLLFVFALNLLGVFEIYLPGGTSSRLATLAGREGCGGAFLHGVFATVLATPCTAPFLGPALGFAFAQPAHVIFAVFAAIAAGMGLPYVFLTLNPGWMRFLPKPGLWMERVKQFMGFLLMTTVLFLLWVLGRQRGVDGMVWAGAFLLVLAVVCWIAGLYLTPMATRRSKSIALLCAIGLVAAGWHYCIHRGFAGARSGTTPDAAPAIGSGIAWEPFSEARLAAARAEGRPIFIDFTADWCVNCAWNERFVLGKPEVVEAFSAARVIPLKADWTNGDPVITRMLKSFGRAGVPAYAVYSVKPDAAPEILPEILTQSIVIKSLGRASKIAQ